ncbi:MAG: hypothetical protein AAGC62_04725 [Pseudomonadota bacterium]
MVTFVYMIRRRPDLSPAAFEKAARASQNRIAALVRERLGATRHRLAFGVCAKRSHCVSSVRRLEGQAPDALLELSWPSIDAYDRMMGTPEAIRMVDDMIDAERSWVDFARSAALLVEKESVACAESASKDNSKVLLSDEAI